jgi:hypothetical protein
LEEHDFDVNSYVGLENVTNIFDDRRERAYRLAREVDRPEVQTVFLTGLGMPTISILRCSNQGDSTASAIDAADIAFGPVRIIVYPATVGCLLP